MAASDFKIEPVDSDQAPDSLVQQGTAVSDRVSEADDVPDRDNDQLQLFSAVLSKRRDEWVRARAAEGTDTRWAEDLDQFNGTDTPNLMAANMMVSVEQGFPVTTQNSKPSRSTVFVQVTRQKTNAAVARLGDILLPTEDRNFSIEPTPTPKMPGWVNTQMPPVHVPPLAEPGAGGNPQGGPAPTGMGSMPNTPMGAAAPQAPQAGAPGAPMQPAPDDPVKQLQDKIAAEEAEAKRRSDLMQQKIEDALDQSDWNAECRRMIHDAGVFGTGVLKGPVVMSRVKKAWRRTTDIHGKPIWSLDVQQILAPASFRVDPRNVYPDPACGERIQDGRGIFELQRLTRKQVRDLAKQPGYIRSQLQAVLREGPQTPTDMTPLRDPLRAQRDLVANEVFEHWIYWGEIDKDDLQALGVEVDDDSDVDLRTTSACIEMVNSTVVRGYLNPLPDGQLPYDFFQWELRPGSVWGYGVPYLMRAAQRVINASWRMILDNAGVSSGPQIVIKPGLITPADQKWELQARKIWYATDDVEDVSKAFATFEFATHQAELQQIVQMAEQLSDAETAVPQLMQGTPGTNPETLGGMQMLMQSANVVLKRLVKQYDDTITKPHIKRYYDYLMEYDEDADIKGPYSVVALGSSALVVQDLQHQALMQLLQLASNPLYAPLINSQQIFMKVLKAQHLDPADVMNTPAEILAIKQAQAQQAQNGGHDPRVLAAQLRTQADVQRTQAQTQVAEQTLQVKQQIAQEANQIKLQELAMERDIETLRVAQQERISVAQVKAQLAQVTIKEQTKAQLHAQDVQLAQAESAQSSQLDAAKTSAQIESASAQAQAARNHEQLLAQRDSQHEMGMQQMQQAHEMSVNDLQVRHVRALEAAKQQHAAQLAAQQREHEAMLATLQGRQQLAVARARPKPKPAAKKAGK